jgi:hypothetical protein
MKWVIRYTVGPDLVGPFDTKEAAEEWAASYQVEYRGADGPLTLVWDVEMLASPESLEWWEWWD